MGDPQDTPHASSPLRECLEREKAYDYRLRALEEYRKEAERTENRVWKALGEMANSVTELSTTIKLYMPAFQAIGDLQKSLASLVAVDAQKEKTAHETNASMDTWKKWVLGIIGSLIGVAIVFFISRVFDHIFMQPLSHTP